VFGQCVICVQTSIKQSRGVLEIGNIICVGKYLSATFPV
jgi:hypothetical protein